MNIWKGIFRTWVVLSLLWVAAAVQMNISSYLAGTGPYTPAEVYDPPPPSPPPPETPAQKKAMTWMDAMPEVKMPPLMYWDVPTPTLENAPKEFWIHIFKFAVVPPLVLFILLQSMRWVVRGFMADRG